MKGKRDRKNIMCAGCITTHKHLIRNMTASVCGFDSKTSNELSVFAIYLKN